MARALYLLTLILLLLAYSDGCPQWCGNVSIVYPFEIGLSCSLDASFNVKCNTSTSRAYLAMDEHLEIIEMTSLHIRVKMLNMVFSTYDFDGERLHATGFGYDFSETTYSFSDDNWLTTIGCSDEAVMTLSVNNMTFGSGCLSFCPNSNESISSDFASCPYSNEDFGLGIGGCRAPIPKGTNLLRIKLNDAHLNWRDHRLFRSSYAFFGEKASNKSVDVQHRLSDLNLNDTSTFLNNSWAITHMQSVLLDWRIIGADNCSEARKNKSTYACKANSDCIEFQPSAPGYLCNCSKGYHGNPYLALGCQDVDECMMSPCDSGAVCINSQGSFSCSCRKGYHDDGKGCIRRPLINIFIGVGVGVGMLMLCSTTCYFLWNLILKKMKMWRKESYFEDLLKQKQTTKGTLESKRLFTVKELKRATDNFNISRIIGKGGQGTVYKGMLSDGKIVAIKKLSRVGEDEVKQLINEVVILSQLNHRNVVKLLGCCLATDVPMLVYEFIPNGTLSHHLRDSNNSPSWKSRLKMAVEIGGALAYLHEGFPDDAIYHRDIKSNNILLNEKYIIKIADFGLSKVVGLDNTHVQCTEPQGTYGYMDPEYANSGKYTDKSDVFSFGVVLAELLTGEKALSMNIALALRFRAAMESNNLAQMLDVRMSQEGEMEEFLALAKLVERCLKSEGKMRPSMREVAADLEKIYEMRETAELKIISQMPSTSTKSYEPKPLVLHDLSKIDEMSFISEISEINEE